VELALVGARAGAAGGAFADRQLPPRV